MSLPKLAVLDDYANIAAQHLDTPEITSRISISYYPETLNPSNESDLQELITRLKPYEAISTMRERTPIQRPLIGSLPNLKIIFTTGPRNGGIDVKACSERGVPVIGTSGIPDEIKHNWELLSVLKNNDTTNEQTWALILGLAKGIAFNDVSVKMDPGAWQEVGFAKSLAGKNLALLGLGRLGLQCAVTGILGFGMKVIAWSPNLTQEKADEMVKSRGLSGGSVRVVASKEELLRDADVLSLHLVLGERSRNIVGSKELELMKSSAFIVNTSRGPLVDEAALLKILKEGRIYGYAADVFNTEPLPRDSEWRSMEWGRNGRSHVLLSPHMGYVTEAILSTMYAQTADNVRAWLDGKEFTTILKPPTG